jgi:hypothetical protein
MLRVAPKLKWPPLVAPIATSLFCLSSTSQQTESRSPGTGRVLAHIDGIGYEGEQPFVSGWACQQGSKESIEVRIYVDQSADGAPKGTLVAAGRADGDSEVSINQACQDNEGGKHRIKLELPRPMFAKGRDIKVFAEGIAAKGAIPSLAGSYTSSSTHPWVFTTASELQELVTRANVSGSYSATRFRQLDGQIARDLAAPNKWDAAYSGCDATTYQYAFSYEPQGGNAAKVRSDLGLDPKSTAPAGAAVVASRLALYAALVKAGANPPRGAPSADRAAALAKQILLAWGTHGFRDGEHNFMTQPSQFCNAQGRHDDAVEVAVGLSIARGIIYSAHAQDLLMYVGALNEADARQLNAFHAAIYELLRNSLNYNFSEHHAWACDHYSNHSANILAGLLTLARLLNNKTQFEAVLYGGEAPVRVSLPWTAYFARAIYGEADARNSCYFTTGADSNLSHPFFSTAVVAPGEIDDRYRNENPSHGIGYPMFTLERLFDMAELMRIAGFDAYGYRGAHGQSIEMATQYYACYAKGAGFGKIVTPENSGSCPNAAQYYGKIVNGVDRMVTIGAYRFPNNRSLIEVDSDAKTASSSAAFALDAILFGKWRD